MVKIHNVMKFIFHITELILLIATTIRNAKGTDIVCMDLSLCNLLKGDLSQESPVLKSVSSKFYKVAEDNLVSNKTICEDELEKCIDDVTTMAIDILQFPKKYKKVCNHKSYSRSLFACKNRINWPKSVANKLPEEYTNCHTDCLIDEDHPYKLSNGKILLDYKFPFPNVTTDDVKFDVSRPISMQINRKVTHTFTAFEDEEDGLTWTSIDSCPENTWGNVILDVHYEGLLQAMQNIIVYCSHLSEENKHINIIQTGMSDWKGNETLTTSQYDCGTNLIPLRGIKFKTTILFGKPVLHREVIKLCKDEPTVPGPGLLDCQNSEGICTIQAKILENSSYLFIKNIRIGCCDLTPEPLSETTSITSTTPPTTTVSTTPILGSIYWYQVIFDHITRYNRFFTPPTVIDETEWITTKCPVGTYVNGIRITNPNPEYFVWRRIMELAFKCGDSQGGQSSELNIYSKLRNKHGLVDSNLNKLIECINGHYTFLQFEYYTEKKRTELVHGWGIRMECSINGKTEEHNYAFDFSSARNVLYETVIETAKEDCGAKNAICGFKARLADERVGCFEGFLLKTICCKI